MKIKKFKPFQMFGITLKTLAATALVVGVTANATAETTGFYNGKTLEVLIPWTPGGGADQWGRYVAATIGPFLGKDARVQAVNRPGAGGVQGSNEFHLRTRSDGRTVLLQSAGQVFSFMYGSQGVRYDFREYEPIVGMAQGGVVYSRSDIGIESPMDLWEVDNLIYGEVSPQAIGSMALAAFILLDIPHQVVFGYESRGPARLALEQGETNIDFQTTTPYSISVTPLIAQGLATPLFSLGILDSKGDLVRDPAFPDLPTVEEIYIQRFGESPSGVAWDAYKAVLAAGTIKMLWAKPDAPEASIEDLKAAFIQASSDENFMKESLIANGPYEWMIGQDAFNAMSASLNISEEALSFLREIFNKRYGANL